MFYQKRRYSVVTIDDPVVLAEKLTEHTWTCCTAFQHAGVLFVNDSSRADGAQEYAVIADGRCVESITFSWCNAKEALTYIQGLVTGEMRGDYGPAVVVTETPAAHGRCHHCA